MKETKKQKIRDWLENGNPITSLMAVQLFGCINLSGIIMRLRREGLNIDTETMVGVHGERFSRYVLSK